MNKIIIISTVCLTLCPLNLIAQRQKDCAHFHIYGGINKSANENLPWTEFSSYPFSVGCFVAISKEITPLWGWRTSIGFNNNRSRNVAKCENEDTWGWNDIEGFADATFDISDALNIKSKTGFNLKTFAGIGSLWTFCFPNDRPLSYTNSYSRNSTMNAGVRAGVQTSWKVAENLRLGLELSQTLATDGFNGVVAGAPDTRTNLSIGLAWNLHPQKSAKRRKPIVYANRLKVVPWLPMMIPTKEANKKRELAGRAFVEFPVNETTIYPNYRNNPAELRKIKQSIDNVRFDNSVHITDITLHGYASPESPFSNNERLAKGRTITIKNYLRDTYNLADVSFHTKYTPEDWENLRGFVADSLGGTDALIYRNELLKVIDSSMEPDHKEEVLKHVGGGAAYNLLYNSIYPALRHTDYTITYEVKSYTVNEGRKLIYTHPEALSLEEMYMVATSYDESSEGYYDAMVIAARQFPNNDIANLNAACTCIKRGKLRDAANYAAKLGKTAEEHYITGVIKAMEGKSNWHMEDNKLIIDSK